METIVIIDEYIGEVLGLLDTTGATLRDLKNETGEYKEELREVCDYILKLWDLREKLYEKNPQMPQFELHKESIENKQRVSELLEIENDIAEQYHQKNFQAAYDLSLQLLQKAEYGFFKKKAEAWLWRCHMQINQIMDRSLDKGQVNIEELEELYQFALNAENKQDFVLAQKLYEQLTRISTFSQYELKGQAGMYRCLPK